MCYLGADLWIWVPTRNQQRARIVAQVTARIQVEKRRRVGGPFAASSGGMSDVRSLEQDHPSAGRAL